jgi:hypothetical protein
MKRASMAGVFALCLGLTAACGGGKDETEIAEREPEIADSPDGRPVAITQTGCLTAQGDRFVLTALESAAAPGAARPEQGKETANPTASAQSTTESYQLIGNADELRQLVGKQVRVSGEADPPKVAEVREATPPTSGATGTAGEAEPAKPGEPKVATTTETRLEVTQLRVQSVTATGEACATR